MTVEMRPIASIKVTARIRDTFGDVQEMADSLRERGQINPITIKDDGTLVAGERRWRAARELGWEEIACHIWDEDDAAELLAIEIEENTCREQLTLVEAERAYRRYRVMLGLPEGTDDRSESQRAAAPRGDQHWTKRTADQSESVGKLPNNQRRAEKAAEAAGYAPGTLSKVRKIREAAEDEAEAPEVREVAQEQMRNLSTRTRGATEALKRVNEERERRTRAAMIPGQYLARDLPKAPEKTVTWHERLWDVVSSGRGLVRTAEELDLDPDPSTLRTEDLTRLNEILTEQISDRERLRRVLRRIKRDRNQKKGNR